VIRIHIAALTRIYRLCGAHAPAPFGCGSSFRLVRLLPYHRGDEGRPQRKTASGPPPDLRGWLRCGSPKLGWDPATGWLVN